MATQSHYAGTAPAQRQGSQTLKWAALALLLGLALVAPFQLYPVFLAKALCFALFACAFNLLIGYVGLLSFGHAAFFGSAAYVTAHAVKVWGLTPELGGESGSVAKIWMSYSPLRPALERRALLGVLRTECRVAEPLRHA